MIQSTARRVLADLRQDISLRGYDASEKRHLAHLFNSLCMRYSDSNIDSGKHTSVKKHSAVSELEAQWHKERIAADGGASGIAAILRELEAFIPDLPTEIKSNIIVVPASQEIAADQLLATLRRRGVAINV
jgi:hypothetical protein